MGADRLTAWQTAYARRPVAPETCAAMAEKYAALAALVALPTGPTQNVALRAAARRWPGCLREAQLVGPTLCEARRVQAVAAAGSEARTRAQWLAGDAAAVAAWVDLHLLLADQSRWRLRTLGVGDVTDFVATLDGEARGRWPEAEMLAEVAGPQVRVRQAYRWLAAQASLPLADLNYLLFARRGPWDARPGDPPVSA